MGKRNDILEATEQLLAERGFYGLSMKVLAETAGIAAGTIYRYFENKETLLIELHQHISSEASRTIFSGWTDQQPVKQKYDLLWRNAFNAVLNNPRRLAVMEMLYCMPQIEAASSTIFEDDVFSPLIDFYQSGINEGRLQDWPISALVALSFDTAISLAKKVLRQRLQVNEQILAQVRDASWMVIQVTPQQD